MHFKSSALWAGGSPVVVRLKQSYVNVKSIANFNKYFFGLMFSFMLPGVYLFSLRRNELFDVR